MTIYLPHAIRGNIALINGTPHCFGKMTSRTYSSLGIDGQEHFLDRGTKYFQTAQTNNHVSYIWMLRKNYDWADEFAKVVRSSPEKHRESLRKSSEAWIQKIYEEDGQSQYEYLVAGEIPTYKKGWGMLRHLLTRRTPIQLPDVLGGSLSDRKFSQYLNTFRRKTAQYGVKPITEIDICRFYMQHNHRGLPMPNLEKFIQRGKILKGDLAWLQPNRVTPITSKDGQFGPHVRLTSAHGVRYVSFMTVSLQPMKVLYPGMDLFHSIQGTGLPVEAFARILYKGPKDAKAFTEDQRKAAESNAQHSAQISQDSQHDYESIQSANAQESEAHDRNFGMNYVRIVFAMTATNPAELDDYCDAFMDWLSDVKGIKADRFAGDQGEYYDCWMPAPHWSAIGYQHEMFPDRTAAYLTPGAADALGDPTGMPVGFLESNGSVVRIDFPRGAEINQGSNMIIVGPIGAGKTHLASEIIENTRRTAPSRGLIADQKNEHRKWAEEKFGLSENQYYSIDGYMNPGVFDPFHLIQRVDDEYLSEEYSVEDYRLRRQETLAYQLIETIQGVSDIDPMRFKWENAVKQAIRRTIDNGDASMAGVLEQLLKVEDPEIRDFAESLEGKSHSPKGRLIFGRPQPGKEIRFPEEGIIVLGINAKLDLPRQGQKAVNDEQRMSLAVLAGFNTLTEQFLLEGKEMGVFSWLFQDDAKHFNNNEMMEEISDHIFRLGRSKFCGVIMATQNPSDPPRALIQNTSVYICMGARTEEEADIAMKDLGVDLSNEEIRLRLRELGREQAEEGQDPEELQDREFSRGYLRDLSGRAGLVRFVTPEKHRREFLKTSQQRKTEEVIIEEEASNGSRKVV